MYLLQMNMLEIALRPSIARKSPLMLVAVLDAMLGAGVRLAAKGCFLNHFQATINAVLEWLDRRQLAKVARDDDLDTSKGRLSLSRWVMPRLFHQRIEPLENVILDHADLVKDDDIRMRLDSLKDKLSMGGLCQIPEWFLHMTWRPACKCPKGLTINLQSSASGRSKDANFLSHRT